MHTVTYIKGQTVESVQSYKYLGTIIDSKLIVKLCVEKGISDCSF